MINEVPMTLIGKPSLPANNYAELRKWIEANKGKINLANAGLGAASHLCGLLFQSSRQGRDADGSLQGHRAGDDRPARRPGRPDVRPDHQHHAADRDAARSRPIAVTTTKRLTTPALKNLPTLDEAGLKGFNVTIWHALYAPKGTPKAVIDKVNAALRAALKDPDFIKREEALGAVIITDARVGGAEHKKFVESEIDKWGADHQGRRASTPTDR